MAGASAQNDRGLQLMGTWDAASAQADMSAVLVGAAGAGPGPTPPVEGRSFATLHGRIGWGHTRHAATLGAEGVRKVGGAARGSISRY